MGRGMGMSVYMTYYMSPLVSEKEQDWREPLKMLNPETRATVYQQGNSLASGLYVPI